MAGEAEKSQLKRTPKQMASEAGGPGMLCAWPPPTRNSKAPSSPEKMRRPLRVEFCEKKRMARKQATTKPTRKDVGVGVSGYTCRTAKPHPMPRKQALESGTSTMPSDLESFEEKDIIAGAKPPQSQQQSHVTRTSAAGP